MKDKGRSIWYQGKRTSERVTAYRQGHARRRTFQLIQVTRHPSSGSSTAITQTHHTPTHVPMRASLTPRSAPSGPRPRKGSITPGESYAYTSGSSESLSRVEMACVMPGFADVCSALGVPRDMKEGKFRKAECEEQEGKPRTSFDTRAPECVEQRRLAHVGHAQHQHVKLHSMRVLFR